MLDLGKKCGEYSGSCDLYYVVPGLSMLEGLRKIVDDRVVLEMGELAKQYRSIDVYMGQSVDGMCLTPAAKTTPKDSENETQTEKAKKLTPKKAKKLTPKRGPHVLKTHVEHVTTRLTQKDSPSSSEQTKTLKEAPFSSPITTEVIIPPILQEPEPEPPLLQVPEPQPSTLQELEPEPDFITNYEWEDPRPESPIKLKDLLGWSNSGSDSDDPLYEPGVDISDSKVEDRYGGDDENELEEEFEFDDEEEDVGDDDNLESENDDEEYATARQRVRTCNSRLVQVAQQLQREAAEGKLSAQQVVVKQHIAKDKGDGGEGYESEYYDSDHDLETPPSSGDEGEGDSGRGSRRGQLVGPETDFSTFSWKVGQRFPNRQDFKQAVARYGIMQGKDLSVTVSNKSRRQELGVRCVKGCPFYLYSSWHSKKASFIVKKVVDEHKCHRNIKRNRQLKSTWVAKELLDVFKARPHWPAKDIIETVRRAYKMVIRRDFAYKIKYHAHRLLHGSMQEHYHKVGRYMQALKQGSPASTVDLVVEPSQGSAPPVFQRFFTCFEGLQKGWRDGCRRVICVDAAFLKTFLGGQIMCAIGRDGNNQMFPIAWATIEGENSSSWIWFFTHIQTCLQLGDGTGVAIISDEHLVNLLSKLLLLMLFILL
ncbi:Proteoglycan 4 [Bienertia sinuspersici]